MDGNARQVLGLTRAAAMAITLLIGMGSFVLSWAALRDLAARAGWSAQLAWVWPLIVDGAILMGTMGVVALAPYPEQATSRRFMWRVLAASAAFSIGCNALHAVIPRTAPINPWLAAGIAMVPPAMLLAATHILALLARVRVPNQAAAQQVSCADHRDDVPANEGMADRADEYQADGAAFERTAPPPPDSIMPAVRERWLQVAGEIARGALVKGTNAEEITDVLYLSYERELSHRAIGRQLEMDHRAVGKIVAASAELLRSGRVDVAGTAAAS